MRLGWRTLRVDSLELATIENAHKVHKTLFFYCLAVICTTTGGTEQMRACVSRYDQSA